MSEEKLLRLIDLERSRGNSQGELDALKALRDFRSQPLDLPDVSAQEPSGQQDLSPEAQGLDVDQQKMLLEARRRQQEAGGYMDAGLDDMTPGGVLRAQAMEELRKTNPYLAQQIEDMSGLEKVGVGFQKGLRKIARGAGKTVGANLFEDIADPSLEALSDVSAGAMIGEFAGEVAPFAAVSPFAAVPRTIGGRVAAGGALGGSEGAAIAAGEDRGVADIAISGGLGLLLGGGGEVFIPAVRRAMRKRAKSLGIKSPLTRDGELTQEAKLKLAENNIDEIEFIRSSVVDSDLPQGQIDTLIAQIDQPSLPGTGISATRGEAIQSQGDDALSQLKLEQQLLEQSGEAGDEFRAFKLRQSQEIDQYLKDLAPEEVADLGPAIKDAIELRESSARFARKEAYEKLAEVTDGVDVGLSGRSVIDALPDPGDAADFAAMLPAQAKAVDDLLSEFGITKARDGFDREITPLTVANYERLRKRLGNIERGDITGNTSRIIGPVRSALDNEFELASKALEASGSESVARAAKNARLKHSALKTEFDEKGLVDQLIATKGRGSAIPKVENSQVYTKIISPSTSTEQVESLVKSLDRAGSKGKLAKSQLKSQMVIDLIDSGFHAKSRKIKGESIFGANAFLSRFEKLKPKLEKVMSESDMRSLNVLAKDLKDIVPPSGAIPKGSAGFFVDALEKAGVWTLLDKVAPGVGGVVGNQIKGMSRAAKDERLAAKAMQRPQNIELRDLLLSDYPALTAVLLPAAAVAEEENP
ncbi:MAG: hypothetical protein CMI54_04825 [Parcubacteria group bacterium]|nr:hypothetical protein [Parcubacteria group bacterium]